MAARIGLLLRRAALCPPENSAPRNASARRWLAAVVHRSTSIGYWKSSRHGLRVGLVFFLVARYFWQEGRKQESRADVLLAITFGLGLCWPWRCVSQFDWVFCSGVDLLALRGAGAFHLRADGDGSVRRRASPRRAQHARALEFEPGDLRLRRRRNSQDAGPGARPRPERGPHSGRRALPATTRRAPRRPPWSSQV